MSMMSIRCPGCDRAYKLPDKHLGKKVTCADSACGVTFLAEPPEPEQDMSSENREGVFFEGIDESVKFAAPTPQSRFLGSTRSKQTACRFAMLGRLMLFGGLVLMLIGTFAKSTIYHGSSGSGAFTIEAGDSFNFPKAATKATIILAGMALMIAGASMWSGSREQPSIFDSAIVAFGTAIIIVTSILVAFNFGN